MQLKLVMLLKLLSEAYVKMMQQSSEKIISINNIHTWPAGDRTPKDIKEKA